jgi:hypothetical protein
MKKGHRMVMPRDSVSSKDRNTIFVPPHARFTNQQRRFMIHAFDIQFSDLGRIPQDCEPALRRPYRNAGVTVN